MQEMLGAPKIEGVLLKRALVLISAQAMLVFLKVPGLGRMRWCWDLTKGLTRGCVVGGQGIIGSYFSNLTPNLKSLLSKCKRVKISLPKRVKLL